MRTLLLLAILILSGCYGQGPAYYSYEGMQITAQRQCDQIADAHGFTGNTRQQYMGLCLGAGGGGNVVLMPYPYRGTQPSTIGQPDQFGPLGYRGPTWEQFNQFIAPPPKN